MVTVLVLSMLLGGQSIEFFSETLMAEVAGIIEEPQRAGRAAASMERTNTRLKLLVERRDAYLARLSEIDQQFGTPESEYEQVLEQLWEERRSAQADYLDEIFTLRSNMTHREWEAAFSLHK